MGIMRANTIRPDQHVDGVKAGQQKVGAGPHVAAGNDDRQLQPGMLVVQAVLFVLAVLVRQRA